MTYSMLFRSHLAPRIILQILLLTVCPLFAVAQSDPRLQYDEYTKWSEGLCVVKKDGKMGYLSEKGELVTPLIYREAFGIYKGYGVIRTFDLKMGLIDKTGKVVLEPRYDGIGIEFREGYRTVMLNQKWGFINESMQVVLSPRFESATWFANGLALVSAGSAYFFINTKGEKAFSGEFDEAYHFSDGVARVRKGSKWGYIKPDGSWQIQPQFDYATAFIDGNAIVVNEGKYSFVDKSSGRVQAPVKTKAGDAFPSITLGGKDWAAVNLKAGTFQNGDPILYCRNEAEARRASYNRIPAYRFVNDDPSTEAVFGRLYNCWAITDSRGLAPKGWHIAEKEDWVNLRKLLTGDGKWPARVSTVKSTTHWGRHPLTSCSETNGNNLLGLNLYPALPDKKSHLGEYASFDQVRGQYFFEGQFVDDCDEEGFFDGSYNYANNYKAVRCVRGDKKPEPFVLKKPSDRSIPWTVIGYDVWSTQNLDVETFRNGDRIPQARTAEEWKAALEKKQPAWCYYNNDPANGAKYGKLYNYYAVIDRRKLAPKGWHIPWRHDFDHLESELHLIYMRDKGAMKGGLLRTTTGWSPSQYKVDNATGFTALPAGVREPDGSFGEVGNFTFIWLRDLGEKAWAFSLDTGNAVTLTDENPGCGFSVRLVYDRD